MSRTTESARGSAPRLRVAAALREAVVRWAIAAEALPAEFRPQNPGPAEEAVLEVRIAAAGGAPFASARLRVGGQERVIEAGGSGGGGAWRHDAETGLEHIDVPGVVNVTLRASGDGAAAELVYARTPLLRRLGLAGGRYEATGVELRGA